MREVTDIDRFQPIHNIRRSIVAEYLGFTHINAGDGGFNARRDSIHSDSDFDYLNIQETDFSAELWQASFGNAELRNTGLPQGNNVYLAFSVWRSDNDLAFITYGQTDELNRFLRRIFSEIVKEGIKFCDISISMSDLINKYGFRIYTVDNTPDNIYSLLQTRSGCRNIAREAIFPIKALKPLIGVTAAL